MTRPIAAERRVSGCGDRRMRRLGGRRKDDPVCTSSIFAWRVRRAVAGRQSARSRFEANDDAVLCLPTCGYLERRQRYSGQSAGGYDVGPTHVKA